MLTRALLALALICGLAGRGFGRGNQGAGPGAGRPRGHPGGAGQGRALSVPRFNSPAIAYVSVANLKKGDTVEISLANNEKPLAHQQRDACRGQGDLLLQAGKRGVPAGGWPSEWTYSAKLKITRDGKVLIEQATDPIAFE